MDELFRQLAFINAILGGFAITFLSVLVTTEKQTKVVGILLSVASCFVISALGATFTTVIASRTTSGDLPDSIDALLQPMSILFMLGILLLFISLGLTGRLRSRRLGIITMVISFLSIIGAYLMIRPFLVY